jgi:hypothetical protein
MYILKSGSLYWNGSFFVTAQSDAKRFAMDRPTGTFLAYLDLIFGGGHNDAVRFVKLTRKARYSDNYDPGYDDGFDSSF